MLEKVRWKLMVFSGVGAMIISLTLGGLSQVRISVVIVRALIFGVLFALISQGVVILFRRFLPDLLPEQEDSPPEPRYSDNETGSSPADVGRRFNRVMPGGGYDRTVGSDDSGDDESDGGPPYGDRVTLSRLDDESDVDAEEAEVLDDDLAAGGDNPPPAAPAVRSFASTSPEPAPAPAAGRREVQLNVDDSAPSFDSLPDLGDYSSTFSEKSDNGSDDDAPVRTPDRLDSGPAHKSRGGIHTNNDQAVEQFMSRGNEPAEMAKTISTVLKREKNST